MSVDAKSWEAWAQARIHALEAEVARLKAESERLRQEWENMRGTAMVAEYERAQLEERLAAAGKVVEAAQGMADVWREGAEHPPTRDRNPADGGTLKPQTGSSLGATPEGGTP